MQSCNQALNKNTFLDAASGAVVSLGDEVMALQGTVKKTRLLLLRAIVGAALVWGQFNGAESLPTMGPVIIGVAIVILILGLVTALKIIWAPVTAPLYALVEG